MDLQEWGSFYVGNSLFVIVLMYYLHARMITEKASWYAVVAYFMRKSDTETVCELTLNRILEANKRQCYANSCDNMLIISVFCLT